MNGEGEREGREKGRERGRGVKERRRGREGKREGIKSDRGSENTLSTNVGSFHVQCTCIYMNKNVHE